MNRKSARFVGLEICKSAKWVYDVWHQMGLVMKNSYNEWVLTQKGYDVGGKMSNNNYVPVPTFDLDNIQKLMAEFLEKNNNKDA